MYVVRMHRTISLLSTQVDNVQEFVVQTSGATVFQSTSLTDATRRYQDEKQKLPRQLNI